MNRSLSIISRIILISTLFLLFSPIAIARNFRNNNPAGSPAVNIAGTWRSIIGRVVVKQKGANVTATVYYLDGSGTGAISGKLNGRNLSFTWKDRSGRGYNGTGSARVSEDGRSIRGTIRVSDGRSQPFTLTR